MGNIQMEADQIRFKNSTYRNVQAGLAAALEGGGGGGTTVVANPEGSATADLSKLQVGTTIYGIPETAAKVTYDNTSSGLTADDVQDAIDELNTGLSSVTELIPSGATTSNKLATASDLPDTASGTTDVTGLTWQRYGKVVHVIARGAAIPDTSSTAVTGLPAPNSDYEISFLYSQSTVVGYIQYINNAWAVYSLETGTGVTGYGSLTYIASV